jgi:UDP-N-acetylmuramoyl-L-alanyl-D-glutamate--2,6-diaminopimelate ligase
MEVSSHGIFQKRVEGLRFNTKVFTNLSQDHLDFHNTMQEYADVKSSFFLDHDSEKIINADDRLIKYNAEHATTYSLKNTMSDIYTESKTFENGITAGII